MLTREDITWNYAQTGDPGKACLFYSVDTFDRQGNKAQPITEDITIATTDEEREVIGRLVERGAVAFLARKNALPEAPTE